MPVSTDRHSGFSMSKWELKYLRCRYLAHRNKIASARPAIDAKPPPERPHVQFKKKKALQEERRQLRVVQENLRILDRTMSIMITPDMPTHFSNARPAPSRPLRRCDKDNYGIVNEKDNNGGRSTTKEQRDKEAGKIVPAADEEEEAPPDRDQRRSKYSGRPLTARLKRNTHIIFHWFIQRFGRYVPWWAEINY